MIGTGTIANVATIVVGSAIGLIVQNGIKDNLRDTIMKALGLSTMFIGITGALKGLLVVTQNGLNSQHTMLMILSLTLGALIGELIGVEDQLEKLGELCKSKLHVKGEKGEDFVEGFVTSSLLFCVGAMAIIGSLQDGLTGDGSMLYAKSILDGIAAAILSSTLGIGVFFSVLPLGIYQGAITLSARWIEPFLSTELVSNISFVGSILIFAIGINLIFGKKIKTGNLLPAVLIPVIYELVTKII